MKKMRIVSLVLCVVLISGLFVACGKKQETTKEGIPGTTPGVSAQENQDDKKGNDGKSEFPGVTPEPGTQGKVPVEAVEGLPLSGKTYQAEYTMAGLPEGFAKLSVAAEKSEKSGIVTADSSFIITVEEPVSEEELKENLHLMAVSYGQEMDYTLEAVDTGYKLTPADGLQTNSLYRFVVGDVENPYASFVFQTETELVVKSVYPADRAVGVPTNTGVEIVLSEAVETDFIGNAQEYISIEPEAEGDFRLYPDGKTVVFVPKTGFTENTVYTITVKAGLAGISGKVTTDPITWQFRTGVETSRNEKSIELQLQERDLTVATGETAQISLYCWYGREQKLSFNDAVINIYAYRSTADCIEAIKAYQSEKADYLYTSEPYRYPTEGLTKVRDYTAKVQEPEEYSWETAITLPLLREGSYLVEVCLSGDVSGKEFTKTEQLMLQVTDLVLYTESSNGTVLYWLNDVKNGCVPDAEIAVTPFMYSDMWNIDTDANGETGFLTTEVYKTNEDGVAIQPLDNEEMTAAFVLVTAGRKEAYACLRNYRGGEQNPYYSYLYTDREKYFRNDEIRYFGVLAPKAEGESIPELIYLKTTDAVNPVPVRVDETGYFEGSVTLDDSARWYLNLSFSDERGNYIIGKGLSITDEEKPVYVAEVSLNQLYYRRGDEVTADLYVTFYDGTPAAGLRFDTSFYARQSRHNEVVTTDESGKASIRWQPDGIRQNGSEPVQITFEAYLIGDELSDLWISERAYYFHTDKIFDTERIVPEDSSDSYTKVLLFERDYSGLNTKTDLQYPLFPKNSYGDRLDGTVTVKLIRTDYKKTLFTTEYDPVTKESTPVYIYNEEKTIVSQEIKQVVNGELILPHVKAEDGFVGYYTYEILYQDPDTGYTHNRTSFALAGSRDYYHYSEEANYILNLADGPYDIGQKLSCELANNNETVTDRPVLYTLYTQSGLQYYLAKDGRYEFMFEDTMAPATELYATLLGEGRMELLGWRRLEYDFENNNCLEFEISTDKQVYRPGETVEVSIRLEEETDTIDKDVFVALSVVDEACFDLQEQEIYLSGYLSRDYIYIGRNQRFSAFDSDYRLYDGMDKVETDTAVPEAGDVVTNGALDAGGMGVGITIRKNFLDNPVFTVIPLDGKQEVKYSFTVPDNITEWRLTAIACDPCTEGGTASVTEVKLGYTVSDVVTSLPFFLNAECNEIFLAGDEIIVSARVYGTGVKTGDAISYEARLYDENGELVSNVGVDTAVGETTWLNFGKWDCGSYTVEITAVANGVGDGVQLPFRVTESGTILPVQRDVTIAELKELAPSLYPISLSFYDESYQPYVNAVNRLMHTYTNRNDSKVAYYIAAAASEKLFGENGFYTQEMKEIRERIATTYGLLPRLEYGEGDLYFSAVVCALAPELLTDDKKAELILEFEAVLGAETITDDIELATALFGLAALGQPVYADLNYAAATGGKFTTEARWMLAAAYAYLGDFGTAAELYDSLTAENKEMKDSQICIKGSSTEETIRYTAYALLTASLVRKTDAEGLYNYLSVHTSTLDLYQLEQATYLKYFYPINAEPAEFSWSVGEKTETVTLKPGQIYHLALNKSDWEAFAVTKADDAVRVRASYLGSVAEALEGTQNSDRIKISKSMSLYDAEKNIYAVTLNYTVTTDKNYSSFTISDYIPSGARWYPANSRTSSYKDIGNWSWSAYVDVLTGQSVRGSISVYHNNSDKLSGLEEVTVSGSVTYYIRGAAEGDFAVDYAVLRDRSSSGYAISESGTVNINDDTWEIALKK